MRPATVCKYLMLLHKYKNDLGCKLEWRHIYYQTTNKKQKFWLSISNFLNISCWNYFDLSSGSCCGWSFKFNSFISALFAKQSFENISESSIQGSINKNVDTRIQTSKTVGYWCEQNYRCLGCSKVKNTDC